MDQLNTKPNSRINTIIKKYGNVDLFFGLPNNMLFRANWYLLSQGVFVSFFILNNTVFI